MQAAPELPDGWEQRFTHDIPFYLDHSTQTTHWHPPDYHPLALSPHATHTPHDPTVSPTRRKIGVYPGGTGHYRTLVKYASSNRPGLAQRVCTPPLIAMSPNVFSATQSSIRIHDWHSSIADGKPQSSPRVEAGLSLSPWNSTLGTLARAERGRGATPWERKTDHCPLGRSNLSPLACGNLTPPPVNTSRVGSPGHWKTPLQPVFQSLPTSTSRNRPMYQSVPKPKPRYDPRLTNIRRL